jgi:hypothetical protein
MQDELRPHIHGRNRLGAKSVPKAWERCETKPKYINKGDRQSKRSKRVIDRREAKLVREHNRGRAFLDMVA